MQTQTASHKSHPVLIQSLPPPQVILPRNGRVFLLLRITSPHVGRRLSSVRAVSITAVQDSSITATFPPRRIPKDTQPNYLFIFRGPGSRSLADLCRWSLLFCERDKKSHSRPRVKSTPDVFFPFFILFSDRSFFAFAFFFEGCV